MKKYLIFLSAIVLMTFSSCKKWAGDPVTHEFSIDGTYTELEVHDAFDVIVSDTVSKAIVTVGDKILSKVRVEKDGNKLSIYLKGWTSNYDSDMKVILPYNADLTSVAISGASDFYSPFTLRGQNVVVKCSGSSHFIGSVLADELKLKLSGSSDAIIEGTVTTLNMTISGSSDLIEKIVGSRYALVCDQCECSISGSSEAYIHCDGRIKGSVSGSSDLYYTGNASTRDCSTSGSSSITHDVL